MEGAYRAGIAGPVAAPTAGFALVRPDCGDGSSVFSAHWWEGAELHRISLLLPGCGVRHSASQMQPVWSGTWMRCSSWHTRPRLGAGGCWTRIDRRWMPIWRSAARERRSGGARLLRLTRGLGGFHGRGVRLGRGLLWPARVSVRDPRGPRLAGVGRVRGGDVPFPAWSGRDGHSRAVFGWVDSTFRGFGIPRCGGLGENRSIDAVGGRHAEGIFE